MRHGIETRKQNGCVNKPVRGMAARKASRSVPGPVAACIQPGHTSSITRNTLFVVLYSPAGYSIAGYVRLAGAALGQQRCAAGRKETSAVCHCQIHGFRCLDRLHNCDRDEFYNYCNCNFRMATVVNYSRLFFVARCLCVRGIAMCVTGELHVEGLMVGFNRALGLATSRARR